MRIELSRSTVQKEARELPSETISCDVHFWTNVVPKQPTLKLMPAICFPPQIKVKANFAKETETPQVYCDNQPGASVRR